MLSVGMDDEMARTRTNRLIIGTWSTNKDVLLERLGTVARQMEARGVPIRVDGGEDVAGFSFLTCTPTCGRADDGAWVAILRTHVAGGLADLAVGPLAQRWLGRFLTAEANRRRYPLQPSARGRIVQTACQMVEAPAPPDPPGSPSPSVQPPGGTGVPVNLARWHVRMARLMLEALAEHPEGLILEGLIWFRLPSFIRALKKAASLTVQDLAAERAEQRSSAPWRGLWMGPPPRLYEVHVFRSPGGYRLADRWGAPAVRRSPGETPGETATEELVVAHLVRLSPRRIVAHVPEESRVQAAIRSAFPGRVHTCHGCPRCVTPRVPATTSPAPVL